MPDSSRSVPPGGSGLLVLGVCTLWLVLQNTLLALTLLWLQPHKAVTLAVMVCKVASRVMHG
jgi:hypothetical protein